MKHFEKIVVFTLALDLATDVDACVAGAREMWSADGGLAVDIRPYPLAIICLVVNYEALPGDLLALEVVCHVTLEVGWVCRVGDRLWGWWGPCWLWRCISVQIAVSHNTDLRIRTHYAMAPFQPLLLMTEGILSWRSENRDAYPLNTTLVGAPPDLDVSIVSPVGSP